MKRALITTATLALVGGFILAGCGDDQPTTSTGGDGGTSTTVEMMDNHSGDMDGSTSTTIEMMEPSTTDG